MEETKRNSSNLAINAREGFFHAMLSYRVATDAELITRTKPNQTTANIYQNNKL
jgi:hypothetical protein